MIASASYRVVLTFTEPVLGTGPQNPEVYRDYIESMKPEDQQEDEYKTVESQEGRGWTGFHTDSVEKDADGNITVDDPRTIPAP